ncbi:MAG TPA: hypothetical protein VGM06_18750 [Polyangiaceae bacterium]
MTLGAGPAAPACSSIASIERLAHADVADERRGPPVVLEDPPPTGPEPPACSLRHPVCVRTADRASHSTFAVLLAADRAWDVLSGPLALPEPDVDLDGAWEIYLVDGVVEGGRAALRERDPRSRLDRGTSFGLVDGRLRAGCDLDVAVTRAMASAMMLAASPAVDPGSGRAEVEAIVRLASPCGLADPGGPDANADAIEFQRLPERTLIDPSSMAFDRGASLFFGWLDDTFAREPAGLIDALWSLAPTKTPADAWRWNATPTGFDVLRVSLQRSALEGSSLEDLWVRFAVARMHATPSAREAWHIPWPDHARRLASPEPVYPTGSSYVVVDHAGARPGQSLRIEAAWEDYGRMRWVVLKLDAAGGTIATLPVTSLERGTRASMTVESLEGVDRLVIVGVNVGSTDHPFDPDQGEWEPHGWLLTLEAE